jgi:hypothetical protein
MHLIHKLTMHHLCLTSLAVDLPIFAGEANYGLPPITAKARLELWSKWIRWMDELLTTPISISLTEQQYILAIKSIIGRNHPAYTLMESPIPDNEWNGQTMEGASNLFGNHSH